MTLSGPLALIVLALPPAVILFFFSEVTGLIIGFLKISGYFCFFISNPQEFLA